MVCVFDQISRYVCAELHWLSPTTGFHDPAAACPLPPGHSKAALLTEVRTMILTLAEGHSVGAREEPVTQAGSLESFPRVF